MTRRKSPKKLRRKTGFENFEERLVMTANGIDLDFSIQPQITNDSDIVAHAASDNSSEAQHIQQQYGFDGSGQTIAVIDTGIAWDHFALGGGFGSDYQVVGGWDFAENDANPYDDGPAGYHGTHVSGIIGSSDPEHLGIASGADLVGLRVFDDSGFSRFEWVEEALQWVHDHRNDFANPITTVNLSLGTAFNTHTPPEWSILEEEFAQLEADGIFISVAAGNAFQQFNETGLSFPGSSTSVVPVSSHDPDGDFSGFSQRNGRVLVAPGSNIVSTVPDHLFGGTKTGQFLSASGTSMAAPYVAGSSAVLREAFEFMGITEVTQDQLYEQFRKSADQFYDSATHATYHRVNLQNAIDSIVTDRHGAYAGNATQLGTIYNSESIGGIIGKASDIDAFRFTAGRSGTVTLNITATHDLVADWQLNGTQFQVNGDQVSFQVVAGQQYVFSLGSQSGIGHYNIDVNLADNFQAVDWGSITQSEFQHQVDGQSWFKLNASRSGFLTVQANTVNSPAPLRLEIYNSAMIQIGHADGASNLRMDLQANSGEQFYVKAIGNNEVRFAATNAVSFNNGILDVSGSSADDVVSVRAGDQFVVFVNNVRYQINGEVSHVAVHGGGGTDQFTFAGDHRNEQIEVAAGSLEVNGAGYSAEVHSFEAIEVLSGGGNDSAVIHDSMGNDLFEAGFGNARMSGNGYDNQVVGYKTVEAISHGGSDRAILHGSAADDLFVGRQFRSELHSNGSSLVAANFDSVIADAGSAGNDTAQMYDSAGHDILILKPRDAAMWGNNAHFKAHGFETMRAYASQGTDRVVFSDSAFNDTYVANESQSSMRNGSYSNFAFGFESSIARSNRGGQDLAILYDTAGNDTAYLYSSHTILVSQTHTARAQHFSTVVVRADHGGFDTAHLVGTAGSDLLRVSGPAATLEGSGFRNRAVGFEQNKADGNGGFDSAVINGIRTGNSIEAEGSVFDAALNEIRLTGTDFEYLQSSTDENQSGQYEFNAVDFLYDLFGDWES